MNAADVALAINMTLGSVPCTAYFFEPVCNVAVVQRVTNAAMGQACNASVATLRPLGSERNGGDSDIGNRSVGGHPLERVREDTPPR